MEGEICYLCGRPHKPDSDECADLHDLLQEEEETKTCEEPERLELGLRTIYEDEP